MMKKILLATLISIAGSASAEVRYDHTNPIHVADVNCIAAMSIVRDRAMEEGNNAKLRSYTNAQNLLILKYESIPTMHIDARKILLKNTRTVKSTLESCPK